MSDPVLAASKFLALVLRHRPGRIGLTLDAAGWADIDALIARAAGHHPLTRALIEQAVAENDKQRYAISEDGRRIRARQGHSHAVAVALDLPAVAPPAVAPPAVLYHGTATRWLDAILREGLDRRSRQHVHLSADADTAIRVGARHGRPVVLRVDAAAMVAAGHVFHRSENGVWLTEAVPPAFLQRLDDAASP